VFNFNNFLRSTLIYTVLGFLPLASSFVLLPVYTKYIGPEEYSLIALSNVFQSYISLFIAIGIDAAFSRYYFKYYQKKILTMGLLSTTLITVLIVSAILFCIFLGIGTPLFHILFKNPAFTYFDFGCYVFTTATFAVTYSITAQYYRDAQKLKEFALLALLYFVLVTAGTYAGVVIFQYGAKGSIIGKTIGTAATMSIYLLVFFLRTGWVFKMKYVKELYIFGWPLLIYGLLAITFDSLDRIFLDHYFSSADLGIYNLAFVIASVIGILINSISASINPDVYKLLHSDSPERYNELKRVFRTMTDLTLFFTVLCIALSYPVIMLFIHDKYHEALAFIPILAVSFIPRAYYIVFSYPLFFLGKTKYLPIINFLSVVTGLLSNFIFIHYLGIVGICLSVLIIKSSQVFFTSLFTNKLDFNPNGQAGMGSRIWFSLLIIASVLLINFIDLPALGGLKYSIPICVFFIIIIAEYLSGKKV
jgi:O-antigen/teichoic acid export membrane protein